VPIALRKSMLIEERNPLKQGLKPLWLISRSYYNPIEERIPLKQGLKRSSVWKD